MSDYIIKLDYYKTVESEIKALKARKRKLLDKETRTPSEQDELDSFKEDLAQLNTDKKYWQDIIKIATKQEAQPESATFEKASDDFIKLVTGVDIVLRTWEGVVLDSGIIPSQSFMDQYGKRCSNWVMNSEASRRTIIDLFIGDIVPMFGSYLRIYCEMSLGTSVVKDGRSYELSGRCDYTIGHAGGKDISSISPPDDSHLVSVEAKLAWERKYIWQCVAECSTLYKTRKDAGKKNCQVWGIVTNASIWVFIYIDQDGHIWESEEYHLGLPYVKTDSILEIYRFVYYLVKCCYQASPPTTPASSSDSMNM